MDIFQKHPSGMLISLYNKKNHQGANPFEAKVLFVGRDPNWAINIEELTIFDMVKESYLMEYHFGKSIIFIIHFYINHIMGKEKNIIKQFLD